MGLADIFSSELDERPPKPEGESCSKTKVFDVYSVEVEYRNGETETFETYGEPEQEGDHYRFRNGEIGPGGRFLIGTALAPKPHKSRIEHVELLSRPPKSTYVRSEKWRIEYETEYQWELKRVSRGKEWRENIDWESVHVEMVGEVPKEDD